MPSDSVSQMPDLQSLRLALRSFLQSSLNFQIVHSVPSNPARLRRTTNTLYILDSSFNPPTIAHLRICTSALLTDKPDNNKRDGKRLLLLLATQNADKAPKPAAFEQRLAMMALLARDLQTKVRAESGTDDESVVVDVGITKAPRFIEKVDAIEESGAYTAAEEGEQLPVEQVHLIGFDTLVRLLDTKYYPPARTLQPLEALFAKHRVRVTRRTDDAWGDRQEQDKYIGKLAEGGREEDGGKKEWAGKMELVEGRAAGEEVISSTRVRNAAKKGDKVELKKLVTGNVGTWIIENGLYLDED